MRSPDELSELFRRSGRKVTAQRQSIFRLLEGNATHPSAEAVYEAVRAEVPTISLKTVYQTLYELADMGEIAALDLGTGMVRFDPNVERAHSHLVCRSCKKVRDLDVDYPELAVPPGHDQGYDVRHAEVVFRGLCEECRGPALARDRASERPGAG
ncbi:MAG TPA: Fur family transcriptional regulator [Acidimicrobiales bacterium]|nr:Fur family transcriptional regulator [Acidimicrobiales bacterium]